MRVSTRRGSYHDGRFFIGGGSLASALENGIGIPELEAAPDGSPDWFADPCVAVVFFDAEERPEGEVRLSVDGVDPEPLSPFESLASSALPRAPAGFPEADPGTAGGRPAAPSRIATDEGECPLDAEPIGGVAFPSRTGEPMALPPANGRAAGSADSSPDGLPELGSGGGSASRSSASAREPEPCSAAPLVAEREPEEPRLPATLRALAPEPADETSPGPMRGGSSRGTSLSKPPESDSPWRFSEREEPNVRSPGRPPLPVRPGRDPEFPSVPPGERPETPPGVKPRDPPCPSSDAPPSSLKPDRRPRLGDENVPRAPSPVSPELPDPAIPPRAEGQPPRPPAGAPETDGSSSPSRPGV